MELNAPLEDTARRAVTVSLSEAESLKKQTLDLATSLQDRSNQNQSLCRDLGEDNDNLGWTTGEWTKRLTSLLERQVKVLQTFNIAVFGRTGAGKSTLIEAMTRGDGESVSPDARCDYTQEVTPRQWEGCKLYDTPGINGWGASESREILEAKAKMAVEVADFVLVCYDTQAQQQEEFRKLKEWVKTYNKPVIAILNVRSERWRLPEKVSSLQQREMLTTQPAQHAAHISAELARAGLFDVPVVAMSAKRALIARASLPWKGPVPEEFHGMRKEFGGERLLHLSNFPALESLVSTAISDHATPLRLGVLSDQIRGELGRWDAALEQEITTCRQAAVIGERRIVEMLQLLGYPRNSTRLSWFKHQKSGVNLLTKVERLRGRFTSATCGTYEECVRSATLPGSALGALRTRSVREAEKLIEEAFQNGWELDSNEFDIRCFNGDAIKSACERGIERANDFLKRRVEIVNVDIKADFEAVNLDSSVSVDAHTPRMHKMAALALKVGGIATGTGAAILIGIVGTNFWNPIGWTALGLGIGSVLLSWWGKKKMQQAELRRLEERQKAKVKAREAVHTTYNNFQEKLLEVAEQIIHENTAPLIGKPLAKQLALLSHIEATEAMRALIADFLGKLPAKTHPQARLVQSMRVVEESQFPDHANRSRLLWLGEDWVMDPVNLREDKPPKPSSSRLPNDPGPLERLSMAIEQFFNKQKFQKISGHDWFARVLQACEEKGEDPGIFDDLKKIRENGKPRIFLVGDYNAGKSTFMKRLMIDSGQAVPEGLNIRANPTTAEVTVIPWEGLELVDTPGFQSGDTEHAERTMQSFATASLVIFLFPPNLILGDETPMRRILKGDPELGMRPKQEHTLFLISRSDELGCSPALSKPFAIRVHAKCEELSRALVARGINVPPVDITCIAADPYGMMGDRTDRGREVYDPYREWDGMSTFLKHFRRLKPELLANGVDRSLLEGGVNKLTTIVLGYQTVEAKLLERRHCGDSLTFQLRQAFEEGQLLAAKQRAKAERLIGAFAENLIDQCLAAQSETQMREIAVQLDRWWENSALHKDLEQWASDSCEVFQIWTEGVKDRLNRLVNSQEFKAAIASPELAGYKYEESNKTAGRIVRSMEKAGKLIGNLGRDGVYRIGKFVDYKFVPWEAVKLGKTLTKASIILAWVGVAFDIWDFFQSEKREKKRETERQRMKEMVREAAPKLADAVTMGTAGETETGVIAQFETYLGFLNEAISQVKNEHNDLDKKITEVNQTISLYKKLLTEAEEILTHASSK